MPVSWDCDLVHMQELPMTSEAITWSFVSYSVGQKFLGAQADVAQEVIKAQPSRQWPSWV